MNKESFKIDLSQCKSSWDVKTKMRRAFWQFLVQPVYLLIPGRLSFLRVAILRLMGAQIAPSCNIQSGVDILIPWNLCLDTHSTIGRRSKILNFAPVRIGAMTIISQDAHLCTGTHDYTHPHFELLYKPITIEAEVWVASGAFIGPGVRLGRGCVIGANSVVTKEMPAWTVCAGNPCRPLKERQIRSVGPKNSHEAGQSSSIGSKPSTDRIE